MTHLATATLIVAFAILAAAARATIQSVGTGDSNRSAPTIWPEPPSGPVRTGSVRRTDQAPRRGSPFGTGRDGSSGRVAGRLFRARGEDDRPGCVVVPAAPVATAAIDRTVDQGAAVEVPDIYQIMLG